MGRFASLTRFLPFGLLGGSALGVLWLVVSLFHHGPHPDTARITAAQLDSIRRTAVRVESVTVVQQAAADTIITLVARAPSRADAARERTASAILIAGMKAADSTDALEQIFAGFRHQADSALAHKDTIIEETTVALDSVGSLARRMQMATAAALEDLSHARTRIDVLEHRPTPQAGCGFFCSTGKVVWAGAIAYGGTKYVQKHGLSLPH